MPEKICLLVNKDSRYAEKTKIFLKTILGENGFTIKSKKVKTPELVMGTEKHFGLREIKRAAKDLERR